MRRELRAPPWSSDRRPRHIPEVLDPRVLDAIAGVPRHAFVPGQRRARADADRPLAIGCGQTISRPSIVALMTSLLAVEPDDVVLEIGTGSGYQAAVLAHLAGEVHSIEIIPVLARAAAERLARLGYANVRTYLGDGSRGLPGAAPFERIIVTAAAPRVPPVLVRQLRRGGRMVIPLGRPARQRLVLVEKDGRGRVRARRILPVRFVPLTGRS